jgi:hypothetical protein
VSVNIIPSDSSEDKKKKSKLEFSGPQTNDRGEVLTNHETMDVLIAKPSEEEQQAISETNLVKNNFPKHFEVMKRTGFKFTSFDSSVEGESLY